MEKKLFHTKYMILCSLFIGFVIVWNTFFGICFWENNSNTIDIPVQNFKSIGYAVDGDTFSSTQNDPQLQIEMDGTAYKYMYVTVENISVNDEPKAQVFYTETGEYSEQNSVKLVLRPGENRICFPRAVCLRGLRIDIGEVAGLSFELKSVVCTNQIRLTTPFWVRLTLVELFIGLLWVVGLCYDRIKKFIMRHKWETAVLCLAFVIYALWSVILPYNQAPDEYMRYDVPRYIYTYCSLPRGDDPYLCNNIWGSGYAFFPYLAYLISAFCMLVADTFYLSQFELFHVARMVSVVFSTLTLFYCMRIAKEILDQKTGRLFVVMVGFLPQFAFISSYVNNDSLALLSTAMIVFYWIRGMKTKWDLRSYIGLGISLAICVASYRNVYGYGLCSVLVFICYYWIQYRKNKDLSLLKEMCKKGFVIVGLVALISGWWFIRNYIIYDGDMFGNEVAKLAKLKYAAEQYKPGNQTSLYQQGISIKYMLFDMGWLKSSIRSFVAAFGYMDLWLPNWLYGLYFTVFGAGCAGHLLSWKKKKQPIFGKLLVMTLWSSMGIVLLLSVYYSYFKDYQPQGRYLLPLLVPLMLILSTGVQRLESLIREKTSKQIPLVNFVILFFAGSLVYVLAHEVIPAYYWKPELIPEIFWK